MALGKIDPKKLWQGLKKYRYAALVLLLGLALLLLPAAGLAVVFLYRKLKVEGVGTNDVIDEVHLGKGLRRSGG